MKKNRPHNWLKNKFEQEDYLSQFRLSDEDVNQFFSKFVPHNASTLNEKFETPEFLQQFEASENDWKLFESFYLNKNKIFYIDGSIITLLVILYFLFNYSINYSDATSTHTFISNHHSLNKNSIQQNENYSIIPNESKANQPTINHSPSKTPHHLTDNHLSNNSNNHQLNNNNNPHLNATNQNILTLNTTPFNKKNNQVSSIKSSNTFIYTKQNKITSISSTLTTAEHNQNYKNKHDNKDNLVNNSNHLQSPIINSNNTQSIANENNMNEIFIPPIHIQPIIKVDTNVSIITQNTEVSKSTPTKINPHHFQIKASPMYHLGFSKNSGKSFDPFIEISYIYTFPRFSIESGINYFSQNNINSNIITKIQTQYDFGIIRDTTLLAYKKFHYLSLPLKFIYPTKFGHIALGINFHYLLFTQSYFIEKHYNNKTLTESITKSNNYITGLNNFNYSFVLQYQYLINRHWFIYAMYYQNLSNWQKSNYSFTSPIKQSKGITAGIGINLK